MDHFSRLGGDGLDVGGGSDASAVHRGFVSISTPFLAPPRDVSSTVADNEPHVFRLAYHTPAERTNAAHHRRGNDRPTLLRPTQGGASSDAARSAWRHRRWCFSCRYAASELMTCRRSVIRHRAGDQGYVYCIPSSSSSPLQGPGSSQQPRVGSGSSSSSVIARSP